MGGGGSVSYAQSSACCDRVEEERSAKLRRFIHDYFDEVDASEPPDESAPMADEALVRSFSVLVVDLVVVVPSFTELATTARCWVQ